MSRHPSRGFLCPDCKESLYCIDSRMTQGRGCSRAQAQNRTRRYCCPTCGKRYIGLEVLNPMHYTTKELPECFFKNPNR